MKTRILLSVLLVLISSLGFSKTWTVTNQGSAFKPSDITINSGDTVVFDIATTHNVEEVSKAIYDANSNTPLPGFSLPYGGGTLLPSQLTVGTHYYVCTPHTVWGMKGTITVKGTTGVELIKKQTVVLVYPTSSSGLFHVAVDGMNSNNNQSAEVYSIAGQMVYQSRILNQNFDIDLSQLKEGVYLMIIRNGGESVVKRIIKQ
jgi:plastocyanin